MKTSYTITGGLLTMISIGGHYIIREVVNGVVTDHDFPESHSYQLATWQRLQKMAVEKGHHYRNGIGKKGVPSKLKGRKKNHVS